MGFLGMWRSGAKRSALTVAGQAVMLAMCVMLMAGAGIAEAAPKFAALTVDARNGRVLYGENIDAIRHPASLTKMMTLYVLFQDLKAGKIRLNSPIRMSARAARMAPSKLGVKPGNTITVETAIRALVVKSANDVACAVAETLGGTEQAFASRMTRTARAIGMSQSNFANASGLPNPAQVTTARDMATLGLRLMRDFPEYYPYFRSQSFVFNGRTIKGHNRLLGKFEGTDGIKTGYINASGFNLVSSVRRGDKRLVGVVLGGRSGASRDAYMKKMLQAQFARASNGRTVAALVGSAKGAINPVEMAAAEPVKLKKPKGSLFGSKKKEEAAPPPVEEPAIEFPEVETANASQAAEATEEGDTGDQPVTAAVGSTIKQVEAEPQPELQQMAEASTADMPAVEQVPAPDSLPFQVKSQAEQEADAQTVASLPFEEASWSIQIGAYSTKPDAQAQLQAMRKKVAQPLAGKTALTVAVQKGKTVTYRARFSGFTEAEAKAACKLIAKRKSDCQVLSPLS